MKQGQVISQRQDNTPTILIVDDHPPIRHLFKAMLEEDGYRCMTASDGMLALAILEEAPCDLLLSDIEMPNMNGIELLDEVRDRFPELAVVMVTGVADRQVAINCVKQGAYGYVAKPVNIDDLCINVTNALQRRELEIANRNYSKGLEKLVEEKTKSLDLACEETMMILSRAAEFRDDETAQHNYRMGLYCELLATKYGLPHERCEQIRQASPLHDVGKIGIADEVLLKPGRLTPEEFDVIKSHCEIGYRILADAQSAVLQLGASIAYSHHEKFDGSGYPQGIKGEKIQLEGRIAAICDVFDALTSERVYKKAISVADAIMIMEKERGRHFDPELLDIFLANIDEVQLIKIRHGDKLPLAGCLTSLNLNSR